MDIPYLEIQEIAKIDNLLEIDQMPRRLPKRYIRDAQNPFEFYRGHEFSRRFRFTKESVMHGILPKIQQGLTKANNRGLPVPPVMQLLICLRYYTTLMTSCRASI